MMRLEQNSARDALQHLQNDGRHWFRRAAFAALIVAAASSVLFALLDAATIAGRLGGETVAARPMWLHTFSVAALSSAVAALALWLDSTARTGVPRLVLLATAAANVTVPVLGLMQDETHAVVPIAHCVLAGLLLVMTMLARPVDDEE